MKLVNVLVAFGFIVCGLVALVAPYVEVESLIVPAIGLGLAFASYGALAFVGAGIHHIARPSEVFAGALYPLNFGLSIVAFNLYLLYPAWLIWQVIVVLVISIVVGSILSKVRFFERRWSPAVALVLVAFASVPVMQGIAPGYLLAVGICLISSSVFRFPFMESLSQKSIRAKKSDKRTPRRASN